MIFVNSMSDLFHKEIPTEFVGHVYLHNLISSSVVQIGKDAMNLRSRASVIVAYMIFIVVSCASREELDTFDHS